MQLKKILLLVIILSVLICAGLIIRNTRDQKAPTKKELSHSISNAVDFLYESQLKYGEFETYACRRKDMIECHFDSSPFVTTFVLYSTRNIPTNKVTIMREKAVNFLLSEQESGGVWRFITSRSPRNITPDLDDISTVSYALKSNGVSFENNIELIKNNKDSKGRFFTWLNKKPRNNNVDCVVNANVLLYLGDSYPKVCDYLNSAIKKRKNCSAFYPDKLTFYYMVSRAAANNVTCLNRNKEVIINRILSRRNKNGSFGNSLQTALAVNTLINYGYQGEEISDAIGHLITNQNVNGSWPRETFFLGARSYYGSKELTTALCVEALTKYKIRIQD